jgi:predicted NBD/HSP70 family sugar kinase
MTNKGQTPKDVRRANRALVFALLRRRGSVSCSEIAKSTGLSNPAAEKIVDDLAERGLLKIAPALENPAALGRRPIRYAADPSAGSFLTLNFTDGEYRFSDFAGGEIMRGDIPQIGVLWNALRYAEFLKALRKIAENGGFMPLSASIALVGKQDKRSGEILLSRVFGRGMNLRELTRSVFPVPVEITNDTYLLLLKERESSPPLENACYVYFGRGISCAFVFGGTIYTGGGDLAGELGILPYNGGELERTLNFERLAQIDESLSKCTGEKTIIDSAADAVFNALLTVLRLFDFDDLIIGGPFPAFSEAFAAKLSAAVSAEPRLNARVRVCSRGAGDGLESAALAFCHATVLESII